MIVGNWDLLVQAVEQIIRHPETWDQANWAKKTDCGTAFCVAGWVTHLAGAKPIFEQGWSFTCYAEYQGGQHDIEDLANELLDIDEYDSGQLFNGGNNIAEILRYVTEWAAEDGYELPELITSKYKELTGGA